MIFRAHPVATSVMSKDVFSSDFVRAIFHLYVHAIFLSWHNMAQNGKGGIYMHRHVVRRGESLYKIAKRRGTSVHHLLRLNPQLRNRPSLIYPGERVRVW